MQIRRAGRPREKEKGDREDKRETGRQNQNVRQERLVEAFTVKSSAMRCLDAYEIDSLVKSRLNTESQT